MRITFISNDTGIETLTLESLETDCELLDLKEISDAPPYPEVVVIDLDYGAKKVMPWIETFLKNNCLVFLAYSDAKVKDLKKIQMGKSPPHAAFKKPLTWELIEDVLADFNIKQEGQSSSGHTKLTSEYAVNEELTFVGMNKEKLEEKLKDVEVEEDDNQEAPVNEFKIDTEIRNIIKAHGPESGKIPDLNSSENLAIQEKFDLIFGQEELPGEEKAVGFEPVSESLQHELENIVTPISADELDFGSDEVEDLTSADALEGLSQLHEEKEKKQKILENQEKSNEAPMSTKDKADESILFDVGLSEDDGPAQAETPETPKADAVAPVANEDASLMFSIQDLQLGDDSTQESQDVGETSEMSTTMPSLDESIDLENAQQATTGDSGVEGGLDLGSGFEDLDDDMVLESSSGNQSGADDNTASGELDLGSDDSLIIETAGGLESEGDDALDLSGSFEIEGQTETSGELKKMTDDETGDIAFGPKELENEIEDEAGDEDEDSTLSEEISDLPQEFNYKKSKEQGQKETISSKQNVPDSDDALDDDLNFDIEDEEIGASLDADNALAEEDMDLDSELDNIDIDEEEDVAPIAHKKSTKKSRGVELDDDDSGPFIVGIDDIPAATLNENDLVRLQSTIRVLRDEREALLKQMDVYKAHKVEMTQENLGLKAEIDDLRIELSIVKKRHLKEIDELKEKTKQSDDKKVVYEEKLRKYQKEVDRLNHKLRIDFNQIRQREKELEGQLELQSLDSENQIKARDKKILELKRKIDSLEFNMENAQIKEQRSRDDKNKLEDKITKIMKTLRGSIKILEDDLEVDHEMLEKINKL